MLLLLLLISSIIMGVYFQFLALYISACRSVSLLQNHSAQHPAGTSRCCQKLLSVVHVDLHCFA